MNEIVENVLQLSRRRDSQPQVFQLGPWLRDFTQEFARGAPTTGLLHDKGLSSVIDWKNEDAYGNALERIAQRWACWRRSASR